MLDSIQVYGEFRLKSTTARRVFNVVQELVNNGVGKELSHVDESCTLCRSQGRASDVSRADRTGREWLA